MANRRGVYDSERSQAEPTASRFDLRRVPVSPANLFLWLGVGEGLVISAGCGRSSPSAFASLGPDGSWLKMSRGSCQQMLDGSSEEYSETWPQWGTMRNGECFQQQPLVRRISAKDCSLLPTPTARDYRSGKASPETHAKNSRPLSEQIGGLLNPQFVEAMMGLPIGYTDCDVSAMPSSLKSQDG